MRVLSALLSMVLCTAPALAAPEAQDAPAQQPESLPVVEPAATEQAPASSDVPLAARRALELAAESWARGDREAAKSHLDTVRGVLPRGHWLEPILDDLGEALDRVGPAPSLPPRPLYVPPPARVSDSRDPDADADAETVAETYIHLAAFGAWSGAYLFGILGDMDSESVIPLAFLTGAVGALGAYALDHGDTSLRGGTAAGINAGLQLGTLWGGLGLEAFDLDNESEEVGGTFVWLSGALLGLGGGLGAEYARATRGDVALIHSGGLWGSVLGAFTAVAIDLDRDDDVTALVLGGSLLGVAAGVVTATQIKMSRARVLFTDLGGLGGLLGGVALASMVDATDSEVTAGLAAGGTVVGLGLGLLATRNLDGRTERDGADVRLQPAMLDGGTDSEGRRHLIPGLVGVGTW